MNFTAFLIIIDDFTEKYSKNIYTVCLKYFCNGVKILKNNYEYNERIHIMKKLKLFFAAVSAAIGIAVCAAAVSAEDFTADISSAEKASDWGQTYKLYKTDFDTARLTEDSEFIVEYNIISEKDSINEYPIELIAQCWMETDEEGNRTSDGDIWAKTAPSEFDETKAVFTYSDVLEQYKKTAKEKNVPNADSINDLSGVLCLNVGVTDKRTVLCTGFTITNVGKGSDDFGVELTGINQYIPIEEPAEYVGTEEFFRVTKENFDATRFNSGSKMVVNYEQMGSRPAFSPIDIVLISTENDTVPENLRDADGNVSIKISLPESYDDTKVVFNAQQILSAYGTGNFSQLYDIALVGTNQAVTVTSVEFTNVNQFGMRSEVLAQKEAEEQKANEPVSMLLIIGIIAGVVIVILVGIFIYAKVNSNRTYDVSSGSYIKNPNPTDKK